VESESTSSDGSRIKNGIQEPMAINPLVLRDSQALLAMDHDKRAYEASLSCQNTNNRDTEAGPSFVKEPFLKGDGALVRMTTLRSKGLGLACSTAAMSELSLASKEVQQEANVDCDANLRDQSADGVQMDLKGTVASDASTHPSVARVKKSSESWIVRDLDVKGVE